MDEYGLSERGRGFIHARAEPVTWDPAETTPPPAIQVIEKLGISSDEACERVRKYIEEHPQWGDNIPDKPPDHLTEDTRD